MVSSEQFPPHPVALQEVKLKHTNFVKEKLSSVPLGTRLVALVLAFLIVASAVLVAVSRQLVSSALIDKMDTQLMRQASLVVNNIQLLQLENDNASEDVNSLGQSENTDSLQNLLDGITKQSVPLGERPRPYSTTNNQNLGLTDYFVQIRDSNNKILNTPLTPVAYDGVLSVPTLPQDGAKLTLRYKSPITMPATVRVNSSVAMNESLTEMANTPWRVLVRKFHSAQTDTDFIIYIGLSLYDINQTTKALTGYFVWAALAIVSAAGILALIAVRRSLYPLKRIEQTAAKIAAGDLSQRIEMAPANTEIGSLSASLNTMLSRIERSFKKQEETAHQMKRFVSDASHELRTPLAVIHGSTELYKMRRNAPDADPVASADMVIEHIDKSSTRMSALIEDLLSLARMDEGRGIDITQTIHVHDMLTDSVEDLHALDPKRGITLGRLSRDAGSILNSVRGAVQTESGSDNIVDQLSFLPGQLPQITIGGDPVRMRQVMTNIIGNIHRYTPADSPVEVGASVVRARIDFKDLAELPSTVETLGKFLDKASHSGNELDGLEYVVIRVIDHGPGMSEEAMNRIFERFYTADPSRAREKGGTGLGMSIVQSVIKAHHGLICPSQTPGGGLTFTVVVPVSQTVMFTEDAHGEHLREKPKTPAFFAKRKRARNDEMNTTEINISLTQK